MYTVISPAKRLHEGYAAGELPHSLPHWLEDSTTLAKRLRALGPARLESLMKISADLAALNDTRFRDWTGKPSIQNARQAVLTFAGDTYVGLDAATMAPSDLEYAQEHLGILSGLHGILRPLDLIQPYRLEMGTRLTNPRGKNLYEFWGAKISEKITKQLETHADRTLINLASAEYFKAVRPALLPGRVITPVFKEVKGGQAKVIGFSAKRARGAMAGYIVRERIEEAESLKAFDGLDYRYQGDLSNDTDWVFTRIAR